MSFPKIIMKGGSIGVDIGLNKRLADAKARGLVIVEPAPHVVFVDLDAGIEEYEKLRQLAKDAGLTLRLDSLRTSTTTDGRHFHAVMVADRSLTDAQRIALALGLGGDRMAGLLSMARVMRGIPTPIVFFETPRQAAELERLSLGTIVVEAEEDIKL
jgi:hypothetical protein